MASLKKNKKALIPRILLVVLLQVLCFSYSYAIEDPEYIKIKDWKIEKIGTEKMVLSCKAVFYNPNKAKAKLKDINLSVSLGDTKAGKILQTEGKVKIKKQQAFEIPLRIEIKPETNTWGYLSGILSALSLQDFVVNVKGYLKVSVIGITVKVPVNESEQLNLKQIFVD